METENYFKNKIESNLKEMRVYNRRISDKEQEIKESRAEIAKKLIEDPEDEESIKNYEFLTYDYGMMRMDVNLLATEAHVLYRASKELGLTINLTEENEAIINNVGNGMAKRTFKTEDDTLKLRDKKSRDKFFESISEDEKKETYTLLSESLNRMR